MISVHQLIIRWFFTWLPKQHHKDFPANRLHRLTTNSSSMVSKPVMTTRLCKVLHDDKTPWSLTRRQDSVKSYTRHTRCPSAQSPNLTLPTKVSAVQNKVKLQSWWYTSFRSSTIKNLKLSTIKCHKEYNLRVHNIYFNHWKTGQA